MTAMFDHYPKVSAAEAGAQFSRVLDQARQGPVTIDREGEPFVLLRADDYERTVTGEMADAYPRLSLDELLAGYDRTRHRSGWDGDPPVADGHPNIKRKE